MNSVVRDVLKWIVTLGMLAGVTVYALDALPEALGDAVSVSEEDSGEDLPDDALPTEAGVVPIEDGLVRPASDFSIVDGVVDDREASRLEIGEEAGAAVILAFPRNVGSPSCIVDVRLEVEIQESTQSVLGIYPSAISDLDAVVEGEAPPAPPILDPVGIESATDGSPGRLGFDVTELYRTWVSGAPFPGGSPAPESEYFVVALTPPGSAPEDDREIVMFAGDAGDGTAPTLGFIGDPGCRGTPVPGTPGAETADPAATETAQPA